MAGCDAKWPTPFETWHPPRNPHPDVSKKKIGRNDPCPCGSGKKYKKCHGLELPSIPQKAIDHFRRVSAQREALWSQGVYIQVVKPVIHLGRKVWALGNRVYLDRPPNETFHEFIIQVLAETLGREWWDAQFKETEENQHFIMKCFRKFSDWMKANIAKGERTKEGVYSSIPDGWGRSLLALAWDVASLLHASKIPESLLTRLKVKDSYQGARYELSIAAVFARLGFKIEYLDASEKADQKHCEFFATRDGTSIAVEAKSRHRQGVLHSPGIPDPAKLAKGRGLIPLLNQALQQNPEDRPFMVFLDVNAPQTPGVSFEQKKWVRDVRTMLGRFPEPTPDHPDATTALFFTNYSYHYQTENPADPGEYLMVVPLHSRYPLADDQAIRGLTAALSSYGNVPPIDIDEGS